MHVFVGFNKVLRSNVIQHIECIDYWSFFKLSFVVILLVHLESHHVLSFFDKNYLITFANLFLNYGIPGDCPYFKNIENAGYEVCIIFVFEGIERILKTTLLDLVLGFLSLSNFIAI